MNYDLLRSLHADGMSNREIARRMSLHHRTVASHLGKIGLGSNKLGPRPLNILCDGTAICSKCGERKPVIAFAMNSSSACARKPYRLSFCRSCSAKRQAERIYSDLEVFLRTKHARFRNRAQKVGVPFDLPAGYLNQLWQRQQGLCFYSDATLTFKEPKAQSQVSLDRVEPAKGYVVGNVVLCTDRVNRMKNDMTLQEMRDWTPGWYRRVVDMWRSEGIICAQVAPGKF